MATEVSSSEACPLPPPPPAKRRLRMGRPAAASMSSEPSEEDIRLRAYHKFLHRNGGDGSDWDDWFGAEKRTPSHLRTKKATIVVNMPRAIWKGAISFGLVSIPVELHTAVRDHRPHFRMLHAKDKSPVRFERVCVTDGQPVAWADLVKGYEYAKGTSSCSPRKISRRRRSRRHGRIDIIDFVKADEIDDRFFETPYYLVPSKEGVRAYALLREAIRESGRVGIAKFIMREAQHLAAVEVIDHAIVLSIMRFADELVDADTLGLPGDLEIRKAELDMAKALVNSLAAEWDPSKYTDQYRENLLRIIKAKMKGKKVTLKADEEPRQAEVIDLMERLRRSLAQRGSAPSRGGRKTIGKPAARASRGTPKRKKKAAA